MTTSDTPKGKMLFSSPENLTSWGPSADSGVIACMTAADAQKAETLFNGLQRDNNALRNIVKGAHGALMDAKDVPMPGMDEDLYDPVMTIVTQRNHLREELASNRQAYRLKIEALEELLAEKEAAYAKPCGG